MQRVGLHASLGIRVQLCGCNVLQVVPLPPGAKVCVCVCVRACECVCVCVSVCVCACVCARVVKGGDRSLPNCLSLVK